MKTMGLFVIFRPSSEEFLYALGEGESVHGTSWCVLPQRALTCSSQATAIEVAKRLADHKDWKMTVCELAEAESEPRVAVVDVCHVWPGGRCRSIHR